MASDHAEEDLLDKVYFPLHAGNSCVMNAVAIYVASYAAIDTV